MLHFNVYNLINLIQFAATQNIWSKIRFVVMLRRFAWMSQLQVWLVRAHAARWLRPTPMKHRHASIATQSLACHRQVDTPMWLAIKRFALQVVTPYCTVYRLTMHRLASTNSRSMLAHKASKSPVTTSTWFEWVFVNFVEQMPKHQLITDPFSQ